MPGGRGHDAKAAADVPVEPLYFADMIRGFLTMDDTIPAAGGAITRIADAVVALDAEKDMTCNFARNVRHRTSWRRLYTERPEIKRPQRKLLFARTHWANADIRLSVCNRLGLICMPGSAGRVVVGVLQKNAHRIPF